MATNDDEVLNAFMGAVRALKRNAAVLAVTTVMGGVLFVLIALISTPYFTASTILVASSAVAESSQTNSALSTLSSLSSLAGVTATATTTKELSPFERLQLVLKSAGLAEAVLTDEKAREILFPGRWDSISRSWSEPSGPLNEVRSLLGLGDPAEPDSVTAATALAYHLGMSVDTISGSVRLTFTAEDRDAALYMLRLVLQKADDIVRQDYLVVAQGYTDYILKLLPTVDNVVSHSALTDLMSRYQETVITARVNLPFAELAIDPPNVPMRRSGPQPLIYLLVGFIAGFAVGIVYILIRPLLPSRLGWVGSPSFSARSTPNPMPPEG